MRKRTIHYLLIAAEICAALMVGHKAKPSIIRRRRQRGCLYKRFARYQRGSILVKFFNTITSGRSSLLPRYLTKHPLPCDHCLKVDRRLPIHWRAFKSIALAAERTSAPSRFPPERGQSALRKLSPARIDRCDDGQSLTTAIAILVCGASPASQSYRPCRCG